MSLRRTPFASIFLLYLLLFSQSLQANSRSHKNHKIKGPIKTIVVIVMENRSFDHVLGWLKSTRPEIDGLTGKESNRISLADQNSPEIFVSDDAIFVDSDPGHSFQAIREQIFGSNNSDSNPPLMNGFAQQAETMDKNMPRTVMSGFKPEVLPVYTELANEFGVFDRWFASVPASTQPNRFFVHSATSHGATSNVRKDLIHGFPQRTIFDSLDENDLTFGIYYQNIPATLFFSSLRKLKHLTKFHNYALKFKLHAKLGKLPNYVVVEQRYFDVDLFPANDDHPSHDVALGQKFVKEVYETLRASPQWKEMALLITYDEHGGFYDHVPTPVSGVPSPDGIIGPDPFYFNFDRLGVRVPTILVSPWVDKGTVIHEPDGPTPHSQFEHSSIPATVKKLFNLKSNFLTKRDAWAGTFEKSFQIRDTPRDDCPETLPKVTMSLRPRGPKQDERLSQFRISFPERVKERKEPNRLRFSFFCFCGKRFSRSAYKFFLRKSRFEMARSLSNAKLLSALLVDGFSNTITRRGYAAASQEVVSSLAKGGARNVVKKSGEEVVSEKVSWIPDPKTGCYRPENLAQEIDPAELRAVLLKRSN